MNASLISPNYETSKAGLKPELNKGMEPQNVIRLEPVMEERKARPLGTGFQKVVFYDDLNVTLND
jgi:hypothetical protein